MSIIAYKTADTVSFIVPSKDVNDITSLLNLIPFDTDYAILNREDLPTDYYFRGAWELSNGSISVNIEKAKDIQRNHWRELRKPKLEALDLAYMRALEDGNTEMQLNIVAQKNALRDVTSTSLPNNLNRIKATIPKILL